MRQFVSLRHCKKEPQIAETFIREYPSETIAALGFGPIGLDMPYRIIVQNNPINNIDPSGLKVMLCTRQAFAGDWGRGHSSYIIPHCYIVAGDQIYSWNVEAGGGIHGNENPGNNSCGEIKCKGDQAAFENCVITEAAAAKGNEGNIWIPAMHDCCTWANGVVGKCMKKHCKNNCS